MEQGAAERFMASASRQQWEKDLAEVSAFDVSAATVIGSCCVAGPCAANPKVAEKSNITNAQIHFVMYFE
ncbi:MAG: hypothetical protein GY933_17440 [Hyphomicrobiales bacterium]|nr:hypothetical protein [Hyphomicrobiales bacterium]